MSMIAVVVDTNSVHRDPWLAGETARKLVSLAESSACVLVYPKVVVDELRRQRIEAAWAAHELAAKGVQDMARAGIDVAQTARDLSAAHGRIALDLDRAFAAVLARNGILCAPVPDVATRNLLQRDLDRRRPFMEIEHTQKKKSVGFRDVLIWETVLELLTSSPSLSPVLFVTSDKGFLSTDGKSLHPDLLEDVARRGIELSRVATVKTIAQAISEVEAHAQEAPVEDGTAASEATKPTANTTDPVAQAVHELKMMHPAVARAELVNAATEALYELVNENVSMQMVYDGDYDYPHFVKFTMPGIEDATITGIDQTTEFSFEESPTSPEVLVGSADAVVTLEGAIFRGDLWVRDSSIDIAGELNDHYLEASSEVDVRVIVELDIEGGRVNVIDLVLEDPPQSEPNLQGLADLLRQDAATA